jgi:hypothetical protein
MIELDRVRLLTNQSVEYVETMDGEREAVAGIQRWSIEACVGEALCGELQTPMMTGKPVAVRFYRVETDEQMDGDVLLTRIEGQIGGLYEIEGLGLGSLRIVTREAQEEDEQIIVEAVQPPSRMRLQVGGIDLSQFLERVEFTQDYGDMKFDAATLKRVAQEIAAENERELRKEIIGDLEVKISAEGIKAMSAQIAEMSEKVKGAAAAIAGVPMLKTPRTPFGESET